MTCKDEKKQETFKKKLNETTRYGEKQEKWKEEGKKKRQQNK